MTGSYTSHTDARLRRVTTAVGDDAWWTADYDQIKKLLMDRKLGGDHADPDNAARFSNSAILGGPMGSDPENEPVGHARWRRQMAPVFGSRYMADFTPRLEKIVGRLIDGLLAGGSPVDLHEAVSSPMSAAVMCELLGVPFEERAQFQVWADQAVNVADKETSLAGMVALWDYMRAVVAKRGAEPADDAISQMLAVAAKEPELTTEEVALTAAKLLFAGHEQTVTVMDNCILLLLTYPDQYEAVSRDRSLVAPAVEEMLRISLPRPTGVGDAPVGVCRYARQDLDVDGVLIKEGELVLLDLGSANRDASRFARPDEFDITRDPNPHLSFGHGTRFCIGAPLARMEIRTLVSALLDRVPSMRLAVPAESLRRRDRMLTGGLEALPVIW